MKAGLTFVAVTILVVILAASLSRVPEALARMDTFRVSEVRLEGNRFLTRDEALKTLDLPASASVWDDLDPWEDQLKQHLLVESVRIRRRLPGALVLEVRESAPVALVPTPALEPVDGEGRFLPIDPAKHRLDLPVMALEGGGALEKPSASERRLLAREISRISQGHPQLLSRISELTLHPRGDLRARIWRRDAAGEVWDLPFNLLFRPDLPVRRVHEGLRVLEDARERFGGAEILDLDLRYEDQVVVRLNRVEES